MKPGKNTDINDKKLYRTIQSPLDANAIEETCSKPVDITMQPCHLLVDNKGDIR